MELKKNKIILKKRKDLQDLALELKEKGFTLDQVLSGRGYNSVIDYFNKLYLEGKKTRVRLTR